jgi:RHS repeat-associated protein
MTDMSDGSARTTYTYDADENLTSTAMPGGVTEARGYDDADQLTSIADTHGAATLDADALTLDANGQPSKAATTQNSVIQAPWYYTYDSADQLTAACQTTAAPTTCTTATGGNETTWSYDKAGNMLTKVFPGTSTTYAYDSAEELTKATAGTTSTTYGYDLDGDLTTAGTNTYAYNGAGELSEAVTSAGAFTYSYDDAGNLSSDSKSGTLQQTAIWDLNNSLPQVAEQTNAAGATTADLLFNPNSSLEAMTTPAGTFHATTDWLGSVTGLVSSTGAQVSSTTYTPYGTPTTTGTPLSPIGFAGSYALPSSGGLDNMHARDYNPANGTFTSVDPLLAVSGQPYAYAEANPVSNTDATGAISCPGWICGTATNLWNAWWKEWYTDNPCNNPAAGAASALSPSDLADWIVKQNGGTVEPAKNGLKVLIPYEKRGIMVRFMAGKGGYYRVNIPGRQSYDVSGAATNDPARTHIPITEGTQDEIAQIIAGILEDG